jgi:hypothetical protein
MTPPATGEKTPRSKGNDTRLAIIPVTPAPNHAQELAIKAMFAAFTGITTSTAAATSSASSGTTTSDSSPNQEEDRELQYKIPDELETTVQKLPAILKCSLLSLPSAFTTFAGPNAPYAKESKDRYLQKLCTKSFIPASLKTKFEVTSSKEVQGCTEFFP